MIAARMKERALITVAAIVAAVLFSAAIAAFITKATDDITERLGTIEQELKQ